MDGVAINKIARPDKGYDDYVVHFSDEKMAEIGAHDTTYIIDGAAIERWLSSAGYREAFQIACRHARQEQAPALAIYDEVTEDANNITEKHPNS